MKQKLHRRRAGHLTTNKLHHLIKEQVLEMARHFQMVHLMETRTDKKRLANLEEEWAKMHAYLENTNNHVSERDDLLGEICARMGIRINLLKSKGASK